MGGGGAPSASSVSLMLGSKQRDAPMSFFAILAKSWIAAAGKRTDKNRGQKGPIRRGMLVKAKERNRQQRQQYSDEGERFREAIAGKRIAH